MTKLLSSKSARLSPFQFAKDDCANLRKDGICLWSDAQIALPRWFDDSPTPAELTCRVKAGERCGYFEKFVLPLADQPGPKDDPKRQLRRASARDAYWRQHQLQEEVAHPAGRACPDCGAALAYRKRFCPICGARRRREAYRAARSRRDVTRNT